MPFIPLKEKPFTNVEAIGNTNGVVYFMDSVKTDYMDNRSRQFLGGPNSNRLCDLGTGDSVDGVFFIQSINKVAAFSQGRLFTVDSIGTVAEITGASINTGSQVSFADFGTAGYYSNGSQIIKWVYGQATCSYLADPDAPVDVTNVAFLDNYLIALRANSQRIEFSEAGNPDSWRGEYVTTESRPDNAVSLLSHFGELFIPGESTSEHWTDSGDINAPFQRVPGSITERGCIAPWSVCLVDNGYFFLDHERRVVRILGRQPEVVSNSYDAEIQSLSSVSDAIGIHFNANGATLYVLTFPAAGRTFYYDYKLDYLGEWSYWNGTSREAWLGNCGAFVSKWNKYVVGSRIDGKLYFASYDYAGDGSQEQITEIWTGNINWGTDTRKECQRLRLKLKRGAVTVNDGPAILRLSWRDDGRDSWSAERVVNLGVTGDTESFQTFRRLGVYRSRQWRFRINSASLSLISAEEETVPFN